MNRLVIAVITIAVIILAAVWIMSTNIRSISADGWTLYHSPTCGYCVKQLKEIGWQTYFLNAVDCSTNTQECSKHGVRAYPTWINSVTKQIKTGYIPVDKLVTVLKAAPTKLPTA